MSTVSTTSGGKERIAEASKLLASVFLEDPVITYMLSSMTPEARVAYFPKYFDCLLTAAGLNGAIFHEADDWKFCGVLMPPVVTSTILGQFSKPDLFQCSGILG
ncbi:hypothetical protein D0Z07_6470 [Hyphodiscus hymeniophilus]|uniref:Uncharacterized protein n=1 Tax=Hyphodiscus hymeniophilus TaxID=353542 RepID=A0A9P6VFH0_9HELO|nr:hypothetical protein D0Z07_6470 [Hyphodiscus hymeniophilus]